jgi:hypothetical protein
LRTATSDGAEEVDPTVSTNKRGPSTGLKPDGDQATVTKDNGHGLFSSHPEHCPECAAACDALDENWRQSLAAQGIELYDIGELAPEEQERHVENWWHTALVAEEAAAAAGDWLENRACADAGSVR